MTSGNQRLRIDRGALRKAARRYGPPGTLAGVLWRQFLAERRVHRHGHNFRQRANDAACDAYVGMGAEAFVDVNARQAWANWRTIPANLDGRLPLRPLTAVDLCCGTGDSTAVLAWCVPAGSQVLGLEYSPDFVAMARERRFVDAAGEPADVQFTAQSVLETFRWPGGEPLAEASVDLVNASGAVGCHFDEAATTALAAECARVLREEGLATIDAGPDGTPPSTLRAIFEGQGFRFESLSRSSLFDRFRQLCLRKG